MQGMVVRTTEGLKWIWNLKRNYKPITQKKEKERRQKQIQKGQLKVTTEVKQGGNNVLS